MSEFIHIVLRPSYPLFIFFILIHFGASIILYGIPLPILIKAVGIIMVFASFIYTVGWHALRLAPAAISTIEYQHGQGWVWMDKGGRFIRAELMGDSIVTPALIILNFRALPGSGMKWRGRYHAVVLHSGMMISNEFRRLRVYLLGNSSIINKL